jgi:hypothetical protein
MISTSAYEQGTETGEEKSRGKSRLEKRDPKFEVPGSKLRKPRTSDLEPSSVALVARDSATNHHE